MPPSADPLSTDPRAIKAYQSAFAAAQKIAGRVDAMRWETLVYYTKYRAAVRWRTPAEAEAAKLGFAEGFEAGQNGKALRYAGHIRSGVRLSS